METKWWHNSVVYQIYPRSFLDTNGDGIGDLVGIIRKLDYLENLGIDVIWLSPVYQSPMDDNGYDISDYEAIAQEFGTMEDMENLIEEARKRNIRILMDLVVNHTSDEHPWFKEARKSKDNPYRDYYIWRKPQEGGTLPSDLTSIFGGSAWAYDEITEEYYLHLFSKRQPDLNWDHPQMRQEIYGMMNRWLDKGIGGFRMDVIDLIGKVIDDGIIGNGPKLHERIQEMHGATFSIKDVLTVGETWGATPDVAKQYSNPDRKELSMIFQFEHITLCWDEIHGKWRPKPFDCVRLKQIFNKWQNSLGEEGWNSLFWSNHDLPRTVSKYGDPVHYHIESAKMLATTLHMMKGTPYIYQGEEIGMTNVKFETLVAYKDIETLNFYQEKIEQGFTHEEMMEAIWENSRDNARTPMQWDASEQGGFTSGKPWIQVNPNYKNIHVKNALEDRNSIFYHYQKLIQLRKSMPIITYGDFELLLEDHPQIFAYLRTNQVERLLVISNFSNEKALFELDAKVEVAGFKVLLSNYYRDYEKFEVMTLEPYESIVLSLI
ncbi:MAG: alpha,alpha-phosphotrehalase [Vallitaleaceae bacterium]|nr:alpha,alpha-phosphotrehalase [Vallitaleaceae bacterium]